MRSEQPQPESLERRWISVEEAGQILGVGRARAYQLAAAGIIPTLRISERRLLVPLKALDEIEDALIEQAREVASRRGRPVDDIDAEALGNGLLLRPRRSKRRRVTKNT